MNTSLPARYTDLIENPSPRCACMLVLDNSYSMSGQPMAQLNAGLQQFFQEASSLDEAKRNPGGAAYDLT